ncbi:MAG: hypothetical protein H8D23_16625 [Candidatus Brocadiales bacterium]|nr:hypothetical protein [Candidatus Brocadiales bacterium]
MSESAVSTTVDRDEIEQQKKSTRLNVADGMPKYKAHKIVEAIKIDEGRVTVSGTLLIPVNKDYDPFIVTRAFSSKHMPGGGGYFVRYKDGYESFSPAEAFEDGYTLLGDGLEEDSPAEAIVAKLKADLLTVTTELEEVKKSLVSVSNKYESSTNKYVELTDKYEKLTRKNLDVNEELATANAAVASLTTENGNLEKQLAELGNMDEEVEIDDTPDSSIEMEVKEAPAKTSTKKK